MPDVVISAAILAGGQSRRMGTDKARLRLPGRGLLIGAILERLDQVAAEVFLVANDDRLAELGRPIVPDRLAGAGPLGGIAAALEASRHEFCLVVACDMPFLNVSLLRRMIDRAHGCEAVVPRVGGQPESLHAIYHRSCGVAIDRQLRAGEYKIAAFFPAVRVCYLDEPEIRAVDPDLRSFVNVNTPEEWQAALDRLREDSPGT